ncbi:MAG: fatty acid desaturase [Gammaproteobacteria bacterium]|nr:fatty acid desaturase [Gammaproteobacteria bacterium]MBU1448028.1 fatty acid desaturase [Gammaproteobacteria bacterium]
MRTRIFRHADGILPNSLAITYALSGYGVGLWLMTSSNLAVASLATLWFAHALIIAAYLFHEFAHDTIFARHDANSWGGVLMIWLTGSCYARYEHLRHKHVRHHVDRADVISLDTKALVRSLPAPLRRFMLLLEWLYIPAVELLMHAFVIALPFLREERRADRKRVALILLLRGIAFAMLAYYSMQALLLYVVAYLVMVTVLRFADAFQHTYDAYAILESDKVPDEKLRDKAYEQGNTYSNLVSVCRPWLNLLILNFPYHNAHHEQLAVPWYRLPALHRKLYGDSNGQVIPMSRLLLPFHRHRVTRVLSDDYGVVDTAAGKAEGFIGAVSVSFLTAV